MNNINTIVELKNGFQYYNKSGDRYKISIVANDNYEDNFLTWKMDRSLILRESKSGKSIIFAVPGTDLSFCISKKWIKDDDSSKQYVIVSFPIGGKTTWMYFGEGINKRPILINWHKIRELAIGQQTYTIESLRWRELNVFDESMTINDRNELLIERLERTTALALEQAKQRAIELKALADIEEETTRSMNSIKAIKKTVSDKKKAELKKTIEDKVDNWNNKNKSAQFQIDNLIKMKDKQNGKYTEIVWKELIDEKLRYLNMINYDATTFTENKNNESILWDD